MTKEIIAYFNFANVPKNFVEIARVTSGFWRPDL